MKPKNAHIASQPLSSVQHGNNNKALNETQEADTEQKWTDRKQWQQRKHAQQMTMPTKTIETNDNNRICNDTRCVGLRSVRASMCPCLTTWKRTNGIQMYAPNQTTECICIVHLFDALSHSVSISGICDMRIFWQSIWKIATSTSDEESPLSRS